jgi:hypothetical protein
MPRQLSKIINEDDDDSDKNVITKKPIYIWYKIWHQQKKMSFGCSK